MTLNCQPGVLSILFSTAAGLILAVLSSLLTKGYRANNTECPAKLREAKITFTLDSSLAALVSSAQLSCLGVKP